MYSDTDFGVTNSTGEQLQGGFPMFRQPSANPESFADAIVGVCTGFAAVTLIFTVLRIWSRLVGIGKLALDDYVAIVNWFLFLFLSICVGYTTKFGAGLHTYDIPLEVLFQDRKFPANYIMTFAYTLSTAFVKVSILLFYLRLSPHLLFRISCYCTIGYVSLCTIGVVPPMVYTCSPIKAVWTPWLYPEAKCINVLLLYRVAAVLQVSGDVLLIFLPMPLVARLKLPMGQKLQIMVIFALGGISVVAGIARMYYVFQSDDADFNWVSSQAMLWSEIEVGLGTICANLPAARSLYRMLVPQQPGPKLSTSSWLGGGIADYKEKKKMDLDSDFLETCDTPSYIDMLEEGRKRRASGFEMLDDEKRSSGTG